MSTNKKSITWALVDIGNVLIAADEKYVYDELIIKHKLSSELVKKYTYDTYEHDQFCRGKITSAIYYQALLKYLQPKEPKNLSLAAIKSALDKGILNYDPNILKLIENLKRQGIKIAIVTDTHEWQSEFFRNRIDFDHYADRVFESHKVGKLKADPGYFTYISQTLNVSPEEIILIDDNPKNNIMAKQLGIFAPGYSEYQELLLQLAAVGIVIKE